MASLIKINWETVERFLKVVCGAGFSAFFVYIFMLGVFEFIEVLRVLSTLPFRQ